MTVSITGHWFVISDTLSLRIFNISTIMRCDVSNYVGTYSFIAFENILHVAYQFDSNRWQERQEWVAGQQITPGAELERHPQKV